MLRHRLVARVLTAALSGVVAFSPGLPAVASDDPSFGALWGLRRIGSTEAWARATGAGIPIGIVDTGVDLAHEDLAGKVVAHTNCIGARGEASRCGGSGQDDHGHGTHVAGIAAAWRDNGKGVAGVAPDAVLVVAKVLSSAGSGTPSDVVAGIKWVVDHGARVVNLSLGDAGIALTSLAGGVDELRKGINYAWAYGAVPVLAASSGDLVGLGPDGSSYEDLNAIVVGATGHDDRAASYSSSTGNARWAVVAPGGSRDGADVHDVLSTFWKRGGSDAYEALSGTSMAAPHVAGALALLASQGHGPSSAIDLLLETADAGVGCKAGTPTCRGRINVARATAG